MIEPLLPSDEIERLTELNSYQILDTAPEKKYDDFTRIAAKICDTPIALITLIDKDRQWFKSKRGLSVNEAPRAYAFCARAINQPEKILEIQDARQDKRFKDNPFTLNDPYVIFYAGAPLVTPSGHCLGTICVIDSKPGKLNQNQKEVLRILANQIVQLLEARKAILNLSDKNKELAMLNSHFDAVSQNFIFELKDHTRDVKLLLTWLKKEYGQDYGNEIISWIQLLSSNNIQLNATIEQMLKYHALCIKGLIAQQFNIEETISNTMGALNLQNKLNINFVGTNKTISHYKEAIVLLFECLLLKTALTMPIKTNCWITYMADADFHYFFYADDSFNEMDNFMNTISRSLDIDPPNLKRNLENDFNILKLIIDRIDGKLILDVKNDDYSRKIELQIPRMS